MQNHEESKQNVVEPYALDYSSLSCRSFALEILRDRCYIVYIDFTEKSGLIDIERDCHYVRRRRQELLDIDVADFIRASGIIIDLQKLEFRNEAFLSEIAKSILPKSTLVRIVVTATQHKILSQHIHTDLLVSDIQQAFFDLSLSCQHQEAGSKQNSFVAWKRELPEPIPITLDISQITCRCSTWLLVDGMTAGFIAFDGEYRHGSTGHDDALFIKWRIDEFCELANLQSLIVDLRRLQYEWGDDLSVSRGRFSKSDSPIRILVSPENLEAFNGVIDHEYLVTDEKEVFVIVTQLYLLKKENLPKENLKESSELLKKYLTLEKQLNERKNIGSRSDIEKKEEQQLQVEMNHIWWNLDDNEIDWLVFYDH